jgi:glycerol-3-phosphate dehydrogenase
VGGVIPREPEAAARESFDLVIVGGGIYGVMLLLETVQRGARALLLERDDFGGATSWNSLRIIHGGLRYLQTADLTRLRHSVGERSWFLRTFPDQVRPLACLMPLYGEGTRRPLLMRAALAANDLLTRGRNRDLPERSRLPDGRLLDAAETMQRFPWVHRHGLKAGALWYDAIMHSPQRVLIETLRWAAASGGTALNYVEATRLEVHAGRVRGVEAVDRRSGSTLLFHATAVVNCAGPWCRAVAKAFDRDVPPLFRPSLAFNLLLRREPPAAGAVAIAPRRPGGRVYFLAPHRDLVCAGTFHAPWFGGVDQPARPTEDQVEAMLADLNAAAPGWNLDFVDVARTFSGLLPARADGGIELTVRPAIHVHAAAGGPRGLVSVSGVKFTTARRVAEEVCALLERQRLLRLGAYRGVPRPSPRSVLEPADLALLHRTDPVGAVAHVRDIAVTEAATSAQDVMLRRTDWGTDPATEALLSDVVERAVAAKGPARPGGVVVE